MHFHNVYGLSISLSANNTVATRSLTSYCHGIVFSAEPIETERKLTLSLTTTDKWYGSLRVGLTSHDPKEFSNRPLPRFALPDLAERDGFWLQSVDQDYSMISGTKVSIRLSDCGEFQVFVNQRYIHNQNCHGLPTNRPLWACFDIYGNTVSATFIQNDDTPLEIVARSREAVSLYDSACMDGVHCVRRSHIMLIGQSDTHRRALYEALISCRNRAAAVDSSTIQVESCPDSQSYCQPNSQSYSQPNSQSYSQSNSQSYDHTDTQSNSTTNSHCNSNINSKLNGHTPSQSCSQSNSHASSQSNSHASSQSNSHTGSQSDNQSNNHIPSKSYSQSNSHTSSQSNNQSNSHTSSQSNSHTSSQSNNQSNSHTSSQSNSHTSSQSNNQSNSHTSSQSNSHTSSQSNNQSNSHTSSQSNSQTNAHSNNDQNSHLNSLSVSQSKRSLFALSSHTLSTSTFSHIPDVSCNADVTSEAIASNLYLEHIYNYNQQLAKERQSMSHIKPVAIDKGVKRGYRRTKSMPTTKKHTPQLHALDDLIRNQPPTVVNLLTKLIAEYNQPKTLNTASSIKSPNVHLHFCNLAGPVTTYCANQMLMTRRCVYLVLVHLSEHSIEQSQLDYIDFWLRCIHLHSVYTGPTHQAPHRTTPPLDDIQVDVIDQLSPPIAERLEELRDFILHKPYGRHVIEIVKAVDVMRLSINNTVSDLYTMIEEVVTQEAYSSELIPTRWLGVETRICGLLDRSVYYISYDQMCDICSELAITKNDEVNTLLQFYHDIGLLVYLRNFSSDDVLRNTIILDPHWMVNAFNRILTNDIPFHNDEHTVDRRRVRVEGIFSSALIDFVWGDIRHHKHVLLTLMEKFHLVSRSAFASDAEEYYVPLLIEDQSFCNRGYGPSLTDVTFFINFHGFLPDGLYHMIVICAVQWSQDHTSAEPQLAYHYARVKVDPNHDVVLHKSHGASADLIKVVVSRTDMTGQPPAPTVCARVRRFLEGTLMNMKSMNGAHVRHSVSIRCPCSRVCAEHGARACTLDSCTHLQDLDECLTNPAVLCDNRKVCTEFVQKQFPRPKHLPYPNPVLTVGDRGPGGDGDKQAPSQQLPRWMKGAAKLLSTGFEQNDWITLATELGYKQSHIDALYDDVNPPLALLTNWIVSSGNTTLSIDVLISYLGHLNREDVVDVINKGRDEQREPSRVFLSYQWDIQDEVNCLRDRLERIGFSCWMDIGQMGGGDQLYSKIDAAVRHAKVVIACITPKFVVSHYCNREMSLADLLHKHIIPVMFEKVPWPPPGPMGLLFSQLVYVNLKGVGGHGGLGIHADLNDKYNEIIYKVRRYTNPSPPASQSLYIEECERERQHLGAGDSSWSNVGARGSVTRDSRFESRVGENGPGDETGDVAQAVVPAVQQVHIAKCGVCLLL